MNVGRTVFAELIAHLSHIEFQKCVTRYDGDHHHRSLSCWDQYLAMAFAQFTYRESLRDIEACLRFNRAANSTTWDSVAEIARSTLADANETHDWRIFADFAQLLIAIARPLYAARSDRRRSGCTVSTRWTPPPSTCVFRCFRGLSFGKHKAAVKMHTLLDLRGNIPTFIRITDGKVHDVNILDEIHAGGRCFLCDGPRLCGFRTPLLSYPQFRLLRCAHQSPTSCCSAATPTGR